VSPPYFSLEAVSLLTWIIDGRDDSYMLFMHSWRQNFYHITYAKLVVAVHGELVEFPFPVFSTELYSTDAYLTDAQVPSFALDLLEHLTAGDISNPRHMLSHYGGKLATDSSTAFSPIPKPNLH